MPLFGESYGLSELIALIASRQECSLELAQDILTRKLRRGEVTAYCEWAYLVDPHGKLSTSHRLSPEPWILAARIYFDDDELEVQSSQATEVRWATAIYFKAAELDFLEEKHSAEEMALQAPKQRRKPGTHPTVRSAIKDRILAALRGGRSLSDSNHEAIVVEFGDGASRNTCVAALREALSEFEAEQL